MNRKKLAALVRPYVRARCLTFDAFQEIFDTRLHLEKQVQYDIADELHAAGIELVDELPPARDTDGAAQADDGAKPDEDDAESNGDADQEDVETFDGSGEDDALPDADGPATFDDVAIPVEALVDRKLLRLSNEQLCARFQRGDRQALTALWEKNKGLVYQQALLFWKRHPRGPAVDDLAMASVPGFLKAAERFDRSAGRFTTYVMCWLRQSITRCYDDEGTLIRLPVHMHERLNKLTRLDREYEQMGVRDARARQVRIAAQLAEERSGETWTPEKVADILALRALVAPTSLELPVGAEEDTSLGDFLPDITTPSVEDQVLHADAQAFLKELFEALTPREILVLRQRFGLDDGRVRTLEEVGAQLSVTRERIRQIESKALRKLRRHVRWLRQQDYLEE